MRKNSGFSILELLVAIGIIAIIASIAVPNLIGWRQKAQLSQATRDLYGNFQKAKMEAAKANRDHTISFETTTVDGKTYDYVIYLDGDDLNPPNQTYDDGIDQFIRGTSFSDYPGVSLAGWNDFPTNAGGNPYLIFARDGLPKDNVDVLKGGKVHLQNSSKDTTVTVSLVGGIRIEKYAE